MPVLRRQSGRRAAAAVAALPLLAVGALAGVTVAGPALQQAPLARAGEQHDPGDPADARAHRTEARPLVIGHRGAAGYRPEHTLESYRLAIALGADFIEPDLVPTRDGHLVARHENDITGTTDVAAHPEFADRRTTKVVDGARLTGWFTEDFTLAELKTLRAVERIPGIRQENTLFDGRATIPTLEEVIALARSEGRRLHRTVGIYPETKHPSYFASIGLPLERRLVDVLDRYGYRDASDPVFVQSFEVGNLRELARMTRVRLVQLVAGSGSPADSGATGPTYADLITPAGLREVARYADAIGPDKNLVVPRDAQGRLLAPTHLVEDAHAARLAVHPYTFRAENTFLPTDFRRGTDPAAFGDVLSEYALFYRLGVDGVFSDQADLAVAARDGVAGAA